MSNIDINESLNKLRKLSYSLNEIFLEEIEQVQEMYDNNIFKVAVIGEFSVGKSTFLNALMGKRILYSNMDEATGMVTIIENNKNNVAIINFENKDVKKISIGSNEGYNELNKYLDINNQKDNKVKSVNIQYDFRGIDDEIIFLDTPGLQGISKEQLSITKEAIKEANATIMIIGNKGINKTELDLICERNEEFGKIPTKELFILINKIGEIYDKNTKEEGNTKVNKVLNEVKEELSKNKVEGVKVFAIDSLDYLHSKDNKLYLEFKETKKSTSYHVLTQNEYLERSKYDEFKNSLFNFLGKSNREKVFQEDMKEKIGIIIDEFNSIISETISSHEKYSEKEFQGFLRQENMILENRRKFINILKRQTSDLSQQLSESIQQECQEFKNQLIGSKSQVLKEIDKEINIKSIDNIDDKVKFILKNLDEEILNERDEIKSNISLYYKNLNKLLSDIFNKEFEKLFNYKSNFEFIMDNKEVYIDFKLNMSKFNLKYSKMFQEYLIEMKDLKKQIECINEEKVKGEIEELNKCKDTIQQKKKSCENEYYNEKNKLGNRPSPTQKYKTVTRTRRKLLFFKEEYYEDVPDGLDYTACEIWDDKNKRIHIEYDEKKSYIDKEVEENRIKISKKNKDIQKIENLKEQLKEMQHMLEDLKKKIERKRKEHIERYIEDRKYDIYSLIKKHVEININKLYGSFETFIENEELEIKRAIEKESDKYLINYEKKVNEDIERIKKKIYKKNTSNDNIIKLITELKDIYSKIGVI